MGFLYIIKCLKLIFVTFILEKIKNKKSGGKNKLKTIFVFYFFLCEILYMSCDLEASKKKTRPIAYH